MSIEQADSVVVLARPDAGAWGRGCVLGWLGRTSPASLALGTPSAGRRGSRTALALVVAAGFVLVPGCGKRTRAEPPSVDVGLAGMLGDDAEPAAIGDGGEGMAVEATPGVEGVGTDLESMIAQQAADLEAAMQAAGAGDGVEPEPLAAAEPGALVEPGPGASLSEMLAESEGGEGEPVEASPAIEVEEPPAPMALDDLYAQLHDALGQELASTSEPFRMAVAMIALAAAQGSDPAEAIGEGTIAGDRLSPDERESALAVAGLLGSLLAAEGPGGEDRASVLRAFSEKLGQSFGLTLPKALLCTRVRGFGRYEEFSSTSFLAGRPVRALVYVEVDRFKHGVVDTSGLGGLPVEEGWSVELGQTLELYHDGETGMLAWMRPEEVVLETSRNKQRDFYLLTEITLPQTLTIGSYKLKVVVKDRVGAQQAEALIPIKIVADPALAWSPD